MGNLTTSDMIIVITLVSIILVLVVVIIVLDIINKRNKREENEIDKLFEDEEEKYQTSKIELPSPNTPSRVEEIRYVEEDEELEKTKAKLELLALKEELERQKEEDKLTPLAQSVEEEVLENIDTSPVEVLEVEPEPVKEEKAPTYPSRSMKYNFDKMVESVELDEPIEDKMVVEPTVEVEATPVVEDVKTPIIEEEEDVQIQEAPQIIEEEPIVEEKPEENLDRFVVEEPTIEMQPVYVPEPQEVVPLPVEEIDDRTIEMEPIKLDELDKTVEIQVVEEPKKEETHPVEIHEIATSINKDLKEIEQANLTRMNEVQQDLNELLNGTTMEEEVSHHEDMQEENAIISVEELTKLSDQVYDDNENYQMSYEDEGNEPISIKELEQLYNTTDLREVTEVIKKQPEIVKEEIKEEVKEPVIEFKRLEDLPPISDDIKFKSSPFISPVFGVTESPSNLELEQTANLDKLNEEIKKTNEFLNKLRELQKNLD